MVMVVVIAKRETLADGVLKLLPQRPVGQGFPARESGSVSPGIVQLHFRSRRSGDKKQSVWSGRPFLPPLPLWTLSHGVTLGAFFNTADVTISAPAPQVLGTCIRVFGLPL